MTLYHITYALQPDPNGDTVRYSYSAFASNASDAFNQTFQRAADSIEADYPDVTTRPIPVLTIRNMATGDEEMPDPMKIKAYRAAPDAG